VEGLGELRKKLKAVQKQTAALKDNGSKKRKAVQEQTAALKNNASKEMKALRASQQKVANTLEAEIVSSKASAQARAIAQAHSALSPPTPGPRKGGVVHKHMPHMPHARGKVVARAKVLHKHMAHVAASIVREEAPKPPAAGKKEAPANRVFAEIAKEEGPPKDKAAPAKQAAVEEGLPKDAAAPAKLPAVEEEVEEEEEEAAPAKQSRQAAMEAAAEGFMGRMWKSIVGGDVEKPAVAKKPLAPKLHTGCISGLNRL
ncbi:hypothetical protein T484DRAFT_1816531, partial [Baffinella frigidus]